MYLLNYILFFPAYQLDVTEIQTQSAGFASVAKGQYIFFCSLASC